MRDTLERELPAAIEAERSILGAILLENRLAHEALAMVRAEHFSLDAHRRIYAAIVALVNAGEPADPITLAEKLDRRHDLEAVGGMVCLSSLIDGVPERPSITHYCKIVREKAVLRGLIYIAQNAVAEATEHGANPEQALSHLESSLLALRSNTEGSEQSTLAEQLLATLNAIQRERDQNGELLGLTACIRELDECTTGIRGKEFWVVAAHPGGGKTAYASQVARANARSRRPVKVFSIEMSAEQVLRRALATESGVRALRLRNPKLMSEDDVKKVQAAAQAIIEEKLPLLIDDSSTLTLTELRARCRIAVKHDKAELVIVDHAALVEAPGDNPAQQMTAVGRALRAFSKREGVPTMLLTHLNTPEDHNANTEPTMFDLKYAKDLARDAHVVLLLHRPEEGGGQTGEDKVIIAKMREGQRGSIRIRFDKRRMEFVERQT